jgi:hypothetical protein
MSLDDWAFEGPLPRLTTGGFGVVLCRLHKTDAWNDRNA